MTINERRVLPKILVFATTRWQLAARIAINFADRGCRVDALVPRGHPVQCVGSVREVHRFVPLAPLASLLAALEEMKPDLVVPCDDAAALLLHALHRRGMEQSPPLPWLPALLERSLGNVEACVLAGSRWRFMELARASGVRTPPSAKVCSLEELRDWTRDHDLPLVLKSDYSFGGQGVVLARQWPEVEAAWATLKRRPSFGESVARALLERDSDRLRDWRRPPVDSLTVQEAIDGHPANRAVACWEGEVLAGVSVEALCTQHATGPATVVRFINNAEMEDVAHRLVRQLGVSGLVGFDFMVEAATGAAHLIEMNVRATPACHLPGSHGTALTSALLARLRGENLPPPRTGIASGTVVMFPGEFRANPCSPYLQTADHDVPWEHPALVHDGLQPPWSERGWLAQARRHWRMPRFGGLERRNNALAGSN